MHDKVWALNIKTNPNNTDRGFLLTTYKTETSFQNSLTTGAPTYGFDIHMTVDIASTLTGYVETVQRHRRIG